MIAEEMVRETCRRFDARALRVCERLEAVKKLVLSKSVDMRRIRLFKRFHVVDFATTISLHW